MKEVRVLVFTVLKDDVTLKTLIGGTTDNPRIFWQWTPQRVSITETKQAYLTYYRSGVVRNVNRVNIGGRDDQIYTVEIYAKTPDLADDIADQLVETFSEKKFSTTNYVVNYTYGIVLGSPQYDDGRKLFTVSVNLYMTKIVLK